MSSSTIMLDLVKDIFISRDGIASVKNSKGRGRGYNLIKRRFKAISKRQPFYTIRQRQFSITNISV